jgi:dTDP-N-acetylfucosamine:lipid II N-acetylfucosaminyltransferase
METPDPIRSIHLLSDRKFIPWVKNTFSLSNWTSFYIILNHGKKNYFGMPDTDTLEVSADRFGEKLILERIPDYDIAFHYFLDNIKADIVARSSKDLIHCWCFYGAEVYQQTSLFRKNLYGPETRQLLRSLPEIRFRYDFRKIFYQYILFRKAPIDSLKDAIPHIHAMLWYVEEEINFIRTKINLPPWQFFQFFSFTDIIPPGTESTNTASKKILIGNSATIENNHADVLQKLLKIDDQAYRFSLPMTYGQFSRYKTRIQSLYRKALSDRVDFLEQHLELRAYYQYLQQHPTAIFLHYRQQALGNILYLLYTGTKVYLSKNNVISAWLKNNDIKVSIFEEDFESDIVLDQLALDPKTIEENQKGIIRLLDHKQNEATIQALEEKVLFERLNRKA